MKRNILFLFLLWGLISYSFGQKSPTKITGPLENLQEVFSPSGKRLYVLKKASDKGVVYRGGKRLEAIYLFELGGRQQTPYYLVQRSNPTKTQRIEITKKEHDEDGEYSPVFRYVLCYNEESGAAYIFDDEEVKIVYNVTFNINLTHAYLHTYPSTTEDVRFLRR